VLHAGSSRVGCVTRTYTRERQPGATPGCRTLTRSGEGGQPRATRDAGMDARLTGEEAAGGLTSLFKVQPDFGKKKNG